MKNRFFNTTIIPRRLLLLGLLISAGFCTLASLQALPPVASWLAEKADITADGFLLPEAQGEYDFALKGSTGVKLGEKPASIGDGKSLVFDGTQTKAAVTAKKIPTLSKVEISLQLLLADGSDAADETILRCPQWELRYEPKNSMLVFIIYMADTYSAVRLKVTTGEWLKVVASAADGSSHLTVNDNTVTSPKEAILDPVAPAGAMVMGGTRIAGDKLERPFSGAVADIHILGEQ